MAGAVSPSSSPRLPSPPPIAEDQIGTPSPGISLFEDQGKLQGTGGTETGADRRIRPGTRAREMAEGPPCIDLAEIDSAFPLTEHLKALHYHYTHPPDSAHMRPIDADTARRLAQPPPNTSREIWLYELGRFLIQKTNAVIVALFADQPPCSPTTCPEMRASEWQYLCAVHDPPKSCSAIDYCCHTLDWAAGSLTSSKMFPSRLSLGNGPLAGPGSGNTNTDKFLQQQMKEITNIFRRVYRIYAHAWFQHREMFWKVEAKTGLYILFKAVCDEWGLIQQENYTIPPEAEGLEPQSHDGEDKNEESNKVEKDRPRPTSILPRPVVPTPEQAISHAAAGNEAKTNGQTAKRHSRAPSQMSGFSTSIQEEAEDEEDENHAAAAARSSLGRSSTVLREQPSQVSADVSSTLVQDDEPPLPGITKSDTFKPEKEAEEPPEPDADVTVIEAPEPESHADEVAVTEVKIETVELNETSAADPEDAEKSVED